ERHAFSLNNDLFPVFTNENEKVSSNDFQHQHHHEFSTRKNEESEDSPFNFNNSNRNGVATDKSTLLFELDPNAPDSDRIHADKMGLTPSS
ncbi:unnamed protein product, partial [Didymodactylos carnosus]